MERLYDEKGFQITGFDVNTIPIGANWIVETLLRGCSEDASSMTAEQVYENISVVANRMNEISHIFCKENFSDNGLLLTSEQRLCATNMMFHLARHEYGFAVKEFVRYLGNDTNRRLNYNEAILVSIMADAFENTMTYRKHRPADGFTAAVRNLTVLRKETQEETNAALQEFVLAFNSRTTALESSDKLYEDGRKALICALVVNELEDKMKPKSEKTLRNMEQVMMKRYNPGDKNILTAEEYLRSLNDAGNKVINAYIDLFSSTSELTKEIIWVRLLADIRVILSGME